MATLSGRAPIVLHNYSMARKKTPRLVPQFKTRVLRKTFFRAWRKKSGMTLEQVAEKAGMTTGNLSAMERGAQGYTQAGLEALADTYGVPPGWLTDIDPANVTDILPIWQNAKPSDRKKIVDIATTIVGTIKI